MQNVATGATYNSNEGPKVDVYFDRQFYKIGQKVIVTIVDRNLSKYYDAIDSYRPVRGFVTIEIDDRTVSDSFTGKIFRSSFKETGPHTGVFKALLKVPSTDDLGKGIKGKEIRINYFDLQNHAIWHDAASIL